MHQLFIGYYQAWLFIYFLVGLFVCLFLFVYHTGNPAELCSITESQIYKI